MVLCVWLAASQSFASVAPAGRTAQGGVQNWSVRGAAQRQALREQVDPERPVRGARDVVPTAPVIPLTPAAVTFLTSDLLVKVEKLGEPPKKQVVPGPLTADANKAARCCVDWAIKHYGAVGNGQVVNKKKD